MLLKEIKEILNKWKVIPCSRMEDLSQYYPRQSTYAVRSLLKLQWHLSIIWSIYLPIYCKDGQSRVLCWHLAKLSFENEGEMKPFSDTHGLKEFITGTPVPQGVPPKEVLQVKMKGHCLAT